MFVLPSEKVSVDLRVFVYLHFLQIIVSFVPPQIYTC